MSDERWIMSSKCAGGDCLRACRQGSIVLVQDSKDPGMYQAWTADEWWGLLRMVKWDWTPDGVFVLADGCVEFGLERHDKLTFTGDEWKAFRRGVIDEEFEIDKLREFRSSSSRRGVAEEDGVGAFVRGEAPTQTAATGAVGVDAPGSIVPVAAPLNVPAGRPGEDTPPVSPGLPAVTGQPGPGEPQDKSFVLFDYLVDKEIWFRDDDLAAEVRSRSGSDDDERWFQVGDQDGDALCWASVLRANPDAVAVMLTRSDAPLVPAVETQETGS